MTNKNIIADFWPIVTNDYHADAEKLADELKRLVKRAYYVLAIDDNERITEVCDEIIYTAERIYGIINTGPSFDELRQISKLCKEVSQGNYNRLPENLNKDDYVHWIEQILILITGTIEERANALSVVNYVSGIITSLSDDYMYDDLMRVLDYATQCEDTIYTIEQELKSLTNELAPHIYSSTQNNEAL